MEEEVEEELDNLGSSAKRPLRCR